MLDNNLCYLLAMISPDTDTEIDKIQYWPQEHEFIEEQNLFNISSGNFLADLTTLDPLPFSQMLPQLSSANIESLNCTFDFNNEEQSFGVVQASDSKITSSTEIETETGSTEPDCSIETIDNYKDGNEFFNNCNLTNLIQEPLNFYNNELETEDTIKFNQQNCLTIFNKGVNNRAIGKVRPRRGSHSQCIKKNLKFAFNNDRLSVVDPGSSSLVNYAKMPSPFSIDQMVANYVVEFYFKQEIEITTISRIRYIRGSIEFLQQKNPNIIFDRNPCFKLERPYEPEFISYQIDQQNGLPFNETRCGMCPYCPEIKFRNFKTSTYSQHLALWHGIYTDNYLTPNPSHYGLYNICKNKNQDRRKTMSLPALKKGVVCPVCYRIIETECSKITSDKPLSSYLRHFRDNHRKCAFKNKSIVDYFNLTSSESTILVKREF